MFVLVCFDVSDDRDRYRLVKVLKGFGERVQKSVFECAKLTESQFLRLQSQLDAVIDHTTDSVRYYHLCERCLDKVEWSGMGEGPVEGSFRVV